MLSVCMALLQDRDDEPFFTEFYDKYNKLVYYIAKEHLKNHQLAEDCVQEVFMKFAKNFHNIRGSCCDNSIEGLIRIIARNTAIDIYRKNRRHIINTEDYDITEFFSISDDDFDVCDKVVIKQAVNSLPEEIKNVFYLKYVCGYSGGEIAQMLNITEALVRKRCMVGRQLAKNYIERG